MKPVYQTKFGERSGNCLSACLASLLEIPLEDIPDFGWHSDWYEKFTDFMKKFNLQPLDVDLENGGDWRPDGYYIVNGHSQRGIMHSVIYKGDTLVHDPYPDGVGVMPMSCTIFLVIDPAKCKEVA